jgi:hypothetical protein
VQPERYSAGRLAQKLCVQTKAKMYKKLIAIPLIVGLLSPSLVIFVLQVFVGEYTVTESLSKIIRKQFESGHNLFLLALIGLIPFALLSLITIIYNNKDKSNNSLTLLIFGLCGLLSLMIPAHISVWYPLYGPGRMSSTSVIAFLFIPFYCIVTMLIGLLLGVIYIKLARLWKNHT